MKITVCDSCHVKVNDYAHWYNGAMARNMYELRCIHESDPDTYEGIILCNDCVAKLLYAAKGGDEE